MRSKYQSGDIVNVVGGLGNQLFQWALGEELRQLGREVVYDLSDFESYALHGGAAVERYFDLHLDRLTAHTNRQLPFMARSRTRKRVAPRLPRFLRAGIVTEQDVLDDGLANDAGHERYFLGYWQFIGRSPGSIENLRRQLRFREPQSFSKLGDLSGCTAVHVRLGDYLTSPRACHLPLSPHYYRSAMRELLDRGATDRFLVFSDEIEKLTTGWFDGLPVDFVQPKVSPNAGTDLQLMALCSRLVISASSFGWWAGVLAGPDAEVIYPLPWVKPQFIDRRNFTPAMPDHWRIATSVGCNLAFADM